MKATDYSQLEAFVAVAEYCNFRRAAEQLGIAPSTLSQTIRTLEEQLGVRLLNRTTRSVALSRAGEHLLAELKPALQSLQQVLASVHSFQHQAAGPLRLVASRAAAQLALAPVLGEFSRRYPHIELLLHIDDSISDIVREGFDAGVRMGHLVEKDMVALRLSPDQAIRLVASPDYIARHGEPKSPRELGQHVCIRTGHASTSVVFPWHFSKGKQRLDFMPNGPLTFNDDSVALTAALSGAGLSFQLAAAVQQHLAQDRLVSLLEEWTAPLPGFHIYYPANRHMPAPLRALLDYFKEIRDNSVMADG